MVRIPLLTVFVLATATLSVDAVAASPAAGFDLAAARIAFQAGRADEAISHLAGDAGVLADRDRAGTWSAQPG